MESNTSPFQNETLYTRDGHEVTTIEVPPFRAMPEVLQWGSRVFQRQEVRLTGGSMDLVWQYRECFCYVVPQPYVQCR